MAEYRRQSQQQPDDETPRCHRCGGTGWLAYRIEEIDGHSTAVLQACECPKGRALVKAERERDERFKQYSGALPAAAE